MTARIISKYTKEFKYLQKQFSFIIKSYYSQTDLRQQIDLLLSEINLQLQQINHDTQIAERRHKSILANPLSSSSQTQFINVVQLKQVKKPLGPHRLQQHQNHSHVTNKLKSQRLYSFRTHLDPVITLYPNRSLSIQIQINQLEPVYNNSQAEVFPPNFAFHIHHLHHHLKTNLHFDTKNGLFETGTLILGQRIFLNSKIKPQNTSLALNKKSTKLFQIKYIFRQSNLQMYEGMFSKDENKNILFSITNAQDPSDIIIAMTKINLKDMIDESKRDHSKLFQQSFTKVLYFRKLISFGQIFPIEEMPLFCKVKLDILIKQEIVSPPIEDLNYFFYDQIVSKNQKQIKSPRKQVSLSKSPRKIIEKTPPKRNIADPSVGKSPHHKKQFLKDLLDPKYASSQITSTRKLNGLTDKREKKKYQKLTCLDETETYFRLRNYSVISGSFKAQRFKVDYLSQIEGQIKPQNIDVHENENVQLKIEMLTPLVQIHQNNQNQFNQPYRQSDFNENIYFLPHFSIKIRALICLKNKDRCGKIVFELPFLRKLNKLLKNSNESKKAVPFAYEIRVQPNTVFKMQQSTQIIEELQRRQRGIKTYSKASISLEDNRFLYNKIVRLDSNIYTLSESFLNTRFKGKIEVHQIDGSSLSVFNFTLSHKKQLKGEPQFHLYPFGSVYKVVKSLPGVFSICFKINPNQYLPYLTASPCKDPHQPHNVTIDKTNKFVIIQMAISCRFSVSQNKNNPKTPRKEEQKNEAIHNEKEKKPKAEPSLTASRNSQNERTSSLVEVQFFKAKLSLTPQKRSNSSFRLIKVKEQEDFCYLDMKFVSKEKGFLNILSTKPQDLFVVNGINFKYSQMTERLALQLMNPLKPNQQLDATLILENWENYTTSFIELKIVNRPDQNLSQGQKNDSIKSIKFQTKIHNLNQTTQTKEIS